MFKTFSRGSPLEEALEEFPAACSGCGELKLGLRKCEGSGSESCEGHSPEPRHRQGDTLSIDIGECTLREKSPIGASPTDRPSCTDAPLSRHLQNDAPASRLFLTGSVTLVSLDQSAAPALLYATAARTTKPPGESVLPGEAARPRAKLTLQEKGSPTG